MQEELKKLGFEGHGAEVYLALVDLGQCGAGQLVKKTGLHRNIVYETLDKLISKRLVVKVIQKNVFQYRITDPDKILENQRTNLLLAETLIPDIKKRTENRNDILVWDDVEGFRNFRLSCIQEVQQDGTIYVLGAIGGERWSVLMGNVLKQAEKIRLKKHITYKLITYGKDEYDAQMVRDRQYYNVRYIEKAFTAPANVIIWGSNVALQIYEEPISIIQVTSKPLSEAFLNYFNIMWSIGKDV